MILRHTNDRVTKKHHIKPPLLEFDDGDAAAF
jgi:hypothetical protein